MTLLLVGAPILIAELGLGRNARGDAMQVFQRLTQHRVWHLGGVLGILGSFLVMSFYFVFAGWVLKYLYGALSGELWRLAGEHYSGYFDAFSSHPLEPLGRQALVMVLATTVVAGGVQKGIERTARVLMPVLAVLLLGLARYSATKAGAGPGLAFLFEPDWSHLTRPRIYVAALGQAFFSLSIGMAVFITSGAILPMGTAFRVQR